MNNISKRLNEIKDYYRLSGNQFAIKTKSVKSTVSNYLNGTKFPSLVFLISVLNAFPEVSAEWLMRGIGDMFNETNPDVEQLSKKVYDLKMELLMKEGIIRELRENIIERINKN